MKMRWACMLPVLTMAALTLAQLPARGQGFVPAGAMPAYGHPGMMAGYYGPDGQGSVLSGGPMPGGPMPGGPMDAGMMDPGMMMGAPPEAYAEDYGYGGGMCPHCRGLGCRHCGGHGSLLGDVLGIHGPYDDGGCAAVRWYDFALDYMYLSRDTVDRGVDLASEGIGGPIVLSTDNLDFDEASGFRFSSMFQVSAGGSVEFTYFGTFHWHKTASVTSDTDNLFSVLSQFGQVPPGGFAETDNASLQRIDYSSTFDNFEINFRRRWVAPNHRYQGSWLIGVRYFKLDEDFQYITVNTLSGFMDYDVNTNNSLTGFQGGGDLWLCVVPGLRLGGEFKAGVFGNHASQGTNIGTTTAASIFAEQVKVDDVAFVGNLDLMMLYRLNYNWTFKLGYQFLYVDGVALASENFNTTPPAIFTGVPGDLIRDQTINDNGNVFYHGLMLGAEFLW